MVVIAPLGLEHDAGVRERVEQGLVQELVQKAAVEALVEAVLLRLSRRDVVPGIAGLIGPTRDGVRGQRRSPRDKPEGRLLSLITLFGRPRICTIRSSSRATRRPEIEVSATSARHSRVQLSTTVRIRKRRP